MIKVFLGLLLGLAIGAGTRFLDIPVPAPPKLVGALLVVAMTMGYMGMDTLLTRFPGGELRTNVGVEPQREAP